MTTPDHRAQGFQQSPWTILSFEGGPRVDLRRPLTEAERRALAALELGPSFALFTAENPGAGEPDDRSPDALDRQQRENARRVLRLEEHLAREGIAFRRVDAYAARGGPRERCVAIACALEEAERLARERDQVALFWYDGERFWLWPAQVDEAPRPLPSP